MKIKKRFLISLVTVVLIIMQLSVSATPPEGTSESVKNAGWIDIQVSVPEGFDRSININLLSDSGNNAFITIDKASNYKLRNIAQPGIYKLDFVSIYGDSKKEFKVDAPKEIKVKANEVVPFEASVTINNSNKNSNIVQNVLKPVKPDDLQSTVTKTDTQKTKRKSFTQELLSNWFTMILLLVLSIIYLIIKLRNARYENE